MMPLNHVHKKCTADYKLSKSQENIYHLMYMDIKLFTKNEKELEIEYEYLLIAAQNNAISKRE